MAFVGVLPVLSAQGVPASSGVVGSPIRPLANAYVAVAKSPNPAAVFLFTPTIARLDSGRLVVAYETSDPHPPPGSAPVPKPKGPQIPPMSHILTSDDHGLTWTERGHMHMIHGRLFTAGKSLYYLGHVADLQVARSDDDGTTWSSPVKLTAGQTWHESACNVWYANGNVYLVMEHQVDKDIKTWPVGSLAPVLMRAKVGDDLTQRASWTFAKELPFEDVLPGYRQNNLPLDYFGVPFFAQNYPRTEKLPGTHRMFAPMGWLETNVVQIMNPTDYWYDPTGHTFHLFMRANTGGAGYAALAKVVENADGTMTTQLETVPSGKKVLFLPFPGGQMRFHVLYDAKTKLYWLLSTQATDSMRRTEDLPPERFDLPNNERRRLVLHFSRNMIDWCFAGVVSIGDTEKESRHYASMAIDGDDLVIVSRSGDENAESAHNTDLVSFHRVKNFRDLVY